MKIIVLIGLCILLVGCNGKIFNNCCMGNGGYDIPCPNKTIYDLVGGDNYGCEHGYEDACNDYMDKHNLTFSCWDVNTLDCGR